MTGDELRAYRKQWGLTQSALADMLGLRPKSISDLENGTMKISKSVQNHVLILAKLAEIKKVLELP